MDKNEKFLIGWMAYFLMNLKPFEFKYKMCHSTLGIFMSDKEVNTLLEKIKDILKNDPRASEYITEGPHPDLINIKTNDLGLLLSDVIEAMNYKEHNLTEEIINLFKKAIKKNLKYMNIDCSHSRKLDDLAKLFRLNNCEKKLIIFSYIRQMDSFFYSFF